MPARTMHSTSTGLCVVTPERPDSPEGWHILTYIAGCCPQAKSFMLYFLLNVFWIDGISNMRNCRFLCWDILTAASSRCRIYYPTKVQMWMYCEIRLRFRNVTSWALSVSGVEGSSDQKNECVASRDNVASRETLFIDVRDFDEQQQQQQQSVARVQKVLGIDPSLTK